MTIKYTTCYAVLLVDMPPSPFSMEEGQTKANIIFQSEPGGPWRIRPENYGALLTIGDAQVLVDHLNRESIKVMPSYE